MKLTEDNFTLQWIPQTDDSYIKIVGIDAMERDAVIKQILEHQEKAEQKGRQDGFLDQYQKENKQLKEFNIKNVKTLEYEMKVTLDLKQKLEKTTMENAILGSFKDDVEAFMTMNDVKDLEDLDKVFNNLKEELEILKQASNGG